VLQQSIIISKRLSLDVGMGSGHRLWDCVYFCGDINSFVSSFNMWLCNILYCFVLRDKLWLQPLFTCICRTLPLPRCNFLGTLSYKEHFVFSDLTVVFYDDDDDDIANYSYSPSVYNILKLIIYYYILINVTTVATRRLPARRSGCTVLNLCLYRRSRICSYVYDDDDDANANANYSYSPSRCNILKLIIYYYILLYIN